MDEIKKKKSLENKTKKRKTKTKKFRSAFSANTQEDWYDAEEPE